jgi:serine/threonine protein kinase
LGKGSYGEVGAYSVTTERDNGRFITRYAVKLSTRKGITAADLQEASTIIRLDHPNIIKIRSIGFVESHFFTTLDLASGNLYTILKDNPDMPTAHRLAFAFQMMCGVEYLHSRNILHRDLKPENILVFEENGRSILRIADYGLATALSCVPSKAVSKYVGTPYYISPEVILGGQYQEGLDRWSVGCILYEIFRRRVAFEGVAVGDEDIRLDQLARIFATLGVPRGDDLEYFEYLLDWQDSMMPIYFKYVNPENPNPPIFPTLKSEQPEIWSMVVELMAYRPELRPRLSGLLQNPIFDPYRTSSSSTSSPSVPSSSSSSQVPSSPSVPRWYTCMENLELRMASPIMQGSDSKFSLLTTLYRESRRARAHPDKVYLHSVDILDRVRRSGDPRILDYSPSTIAKVSSAISGLYCNGEDHTGLLNFRDAVVLAPELTVSLIIIELLGCDLLYSTASDFIDELLYSDLYHFHREFLSKRGILDDAFLYYSETAPKQSITMGDVLFQFSVLDFSPLGGISQKEMAYTIVLLGCSIYGVPFLDLPRNEDTARVVNIMEFFLSKGETIVANLNKIGSGKISSWRSFLSRVRKGQIFLA